MKPDEFLEQLKEVIGGYTITAIYPPAELANGKLLKARFLGADFSSLEEMRENFAKARDFLLSHGFVQDNSSNIPFPRSYYCDFGIFCKPFYRVDDPCPFGYQLTFRVEIILYFDEEEK